MNSKVMARWSFVYLVWIVLSILSGLYTGKSFIGILSLVIIGVVFIVGSSIMRKLEDIHKTINNKENNVPHKET